MVNWKKIGEIAIYRRGSFPQPYGKSEWYGGEGAMPFVQVADVEDSGMKLKDKTKQFISVLAMPKSVFVPSGSVIVTLQGSIGKVAITQYDTYVDRTLGIFEGFKIDINKKYFAHQLECVFLEKKKKARGGTIKTITKEEFSNFLIPVPSIHEQNRLVDTLETFSSSIENLKEQIAQRRKQYEHYRDQLLDLEGKDGVKIKKLGNICGIFDGTHQTPKYTESGIKFVSVENITNLYASNKYISDDDYEKNYKIKPQRGDVLMTRIGDVGRCAVINSDEPIAYYVSLSLLRPQKTFVISSFVKYLLESQTGKKEIRKRTLLTAVPLKINLGEIGKLLLPIPSLSMQHRIVDILDNFEANIQNLEAQLSLREKQYEYYRNKLLTFE